MGGLFDVSGQGSRHREMAGQSSAPQPEMVRTQEAVRQLYRPAQETVGNRRRPTYVELFLSPHDQASWRDNPSACATDGAGGVGESFLQPVRAWRRRAPGSR